MAERFTTTEQAILSVLQDRKPHLADEVHRCLPDSLSMVVSIHPHITHIRNKIYGEGRDIVCIRVRKRTYYVLVDVSDVHDGNLSFLNSR